MPEPLQSAPLLKCTHPSPPSPRPSACAGPRARPHALAQDLTQAHSHTARAQARVKASSSHLPRKHTLPCRSSSAKYRNCCRNVVAYQPHWRRPRPPTLLDALLIPRVHAAEGGCAASWLLSATLGCVGTSTPARRNRRCARVDGCAVRSSTADCSTSTCVCAASSHSSTGSSPLMRSRLGPFPLARSRLRPFPLTARSH
jgi:hypothetical protein